MKEEECKRYFIEETRKLDPVLNPLGFVFELSGSAVSSAGPFASGFYIGGFKENWLDLSRICGSGGRCL